MSARRLLSLGVGALAIGAVVLVGLQPRLSELRREFWLDEALESLAILRAETFTDLQRSTQYHAAPILDFILRKWVWFRVFGHEELGLRLPSLSYAVVTLVAVPLVGVLVVRRRQPALYAVAAALALGAWCAAQPTEIHYAAEARSYTFMSMVSVLWAATYLFVDDEARRPSLLAAASLLYLQTHFFVLGFVLAAHGLEAAEALAKGRRRAALEQGFIVVALVAATVAFNWLAFKKLFNLPEFVDQHPAPRGWNAVTEGLKLYRGYFAYLKLPGLPWPLWIALAAVPLWRPASLRAPARRLAPLLLFVLPAELIAVRIRSGYYFTERYYMPFLGFGFALMLLVLAALPEWLASIPRLPARIAAGALCLAIAAADVQATARLPGTLSLPGEDFTGAYALLESVKRERVPVHMIANPCWGSFVLRLYWSGVGSPAGTRLTQADMRDPECVRTALDAESPDGRAVDEFLAKHADGLVALYQIHSRCPARGPAAPPPQPIRVRRYEFGESCLWLISGARRREDVASIAAAEHFPSLPSFLFR